MPKRRKTANTTKTPRREGGWPQRRNGRDFLKQKDLPISDFRIPGSDPTALSPGTIIRGLQGAARRAHQRKKFAIGVSF